MKLYEGGKPVKSWLKSDVSGDVAEEEKVEPEVVSESKDVSMGKTDPQINNSTLIIPELSSHIIQILVLPYYVSLLQHWCLIWRKHFHMVWINKCQIPILMPLCQMGPLPYQYPAQIWRKPCHMLWKRKLCQILIFMPLCHMGPLPSADMNETLLYGKEEQNMLNSDLDTTMPYGTTAVLVSSADMEETQPYGREKQVMLNSDLDSTMPYEAILRVVSSTDAEETLITLILLISYLMVLLTNCQHYMPWIQMNRGC